MRAQSNSLSRRVAAGLTVALLLATAPLAHAAYRLTEVQVSSDLPTTQLWGINTLGDMVGVATSDTARQSFIRSGQTTTWLTTPSDWQGATAMGISDGGIVVGTFSDAPGSDGGLSMHGYVYSNGTYTTYDVPGAVSTSIRGISPNGRYVAGSAAVSGREQGFVLDRSTENVTLIDDEQWRGATIAHGVDNRGLAVGSAGTSLGTIGFLFNLQSGRHSEYRFGTGSTRIRGIAGQNMAGMYDSPAGVMTGFVIAADTFQTIAWPGAASTAIEGINASGVAVGLYTMPDGQQGAFVASPMTAAVPEPSVYAGMLVGLGLIGAVARRRASRNAVGVSGA